MSASHSSASIPLPEQGCPMHATRTLPSDGMPLSPSPVLAAWREEAPVTPLEYPDGHLGWIVTRHHAAQEVLADPRFSQQPWRMPAAPPPETAPAELDDGAVEAL